MIKWDKVRIIYGGYNMSKMHKVDCHCHPLDHRHYPEPAWAAPLSGNCKGRIKSMLVSAIDRGLDAVAITDHNQFTSAIYAKQIAAEEGLPIKVIVGAECSVFVEEQEIHVQALGVESPFKFNETDSVENLVKLIHAHGGLAVLNHPQYYPLTAEKVVKLMDGVEEYNGVNAANSGYVYSNPKFKGFYTQGSDYHMRYGRKIYPTQAAAITLVGEGHPLWDMVTK